MRLLAIPLLLTATWLSMPGIALAQQASEDAAARKPLEAYLQGHATGDGGFMRQAFLPTAHIEGVRDGKFLSWTADEYIAGFTGKPAADEARRKRPNEEVEVNSHAAMARVTPDHPGSTLPDLPGSSQGGGEWKIANKVWTRQAKPATP